MKIKAFTLAEVLITLTIIGIVAAMTVPSLLVNVNEKAWDAQRKALHARLAQALPMLPRLNNYGTFTYETNDEGETKITADTAAETFVATALSSVYKIVNVCAKSDDDDEDFLTACGLPESFTTLGGSSTMDFPKSTFELNNKLEYTTGSTIGDFESVIDTAAVGIETANGESIAVFYNPDCESASSAKQFAQNKICVNFIYDLNGSKGPNQVGKDMGFVTALYRNDPVVVAPMPYTTNAGTSDYAGASTLCKEQDEDYRLPDKDELAAMFYNQNLIGITSGSFWSGSVISAGSSGLAWGQGFDYGTLWQTTRSDKISVRCVRK